MSTLPGGEFVCFGRKWKFPLCPRSGFNMWSISFSQSLQVEWVCGWTEGRYSHSMGSKGAGAPSQQCSHPLPCWEGAVPPMGATQSGSGTSLGFWEPRAQVIPQSSTADPTSQQHRPHRSQGTADPTLQQHRPCGSLGSQAQAGTPAG